MGYYFVTTLIDKQGIRGSNASNFRENMFLGTYRNSIDSKNRMIIPSKFRDQLGGKCMLTKGFDECLYIYTMADFEEMAAKISALPQSDADFRPFLSIRAYA